MLPPLIPHNLWSNRPEYEAAALRVLRSGHVGQGAEVAAFEEELASRFRPDGAACVVSSGTAALYLALRGWYKVTLPTYACTALYNAAKMAHVPVDVCDVEADTFNAPAAEVVVHTYGVPSRRARGYAIEDFTHSVGGSLDGKPCGSLGELSVISFGATKPLGIGQGGAVLGPRDAIEAIRDRRDYDGKLDAFNFQLSDIQAAIGRERLKLLDAENAWRFKTAMTYLSSGGRALWHPTFISVQGLPSYGPISINPKARVWYRYVIRVRDVASTIAHFARHGIEVINPLRPDELLHRMLGLDPIDFPNAEAIAASTVSLPVWPGMTDEQVDRVAEALSRLEA